MFTNTEKDDTVSKFKNSDYDKNGDVRNSAHQVGRKVRDMFNTASDEISQANDKVISEIRTNPVRSSIVALGVGMLIGAVLRR
jgi:ElaB/YqjD/DUF883 family membrane-anchored ribosome-binding protein